MTKLIAFLAIACINVVLAEDLKFFYSLSAGTTQCWLQNLMEFHKCTVVIENAAESNSLMLMVNDPKGKELDRQMLPGKMSSEWEVKNTGPHQICLQNQGKVDVEFEFKMKSGEFTDERTQGITK